MHYLGPRVCLSSCVKPVWTRQDRAVRVMCVCMYSIHSVPFLQTVNKVAYSIVRVRRAVCDQERNAESESAEHSFTGDVLD